MEIPERLEGSGDFPVGEGNHWGKVFFEVIRTVEGGSYYRRNHKKQREKCCGFSLLPVFSSSASHWPNILGRQRIREPRKYSAI